MSTDLYPSRQGQEEKILPRIDPIVYHQAHQSEGQYALDRQQLDFYEQNGFLILNNYMPDRVEPLLNEIESLRHELKGQAELITEPDNDDELRTIFRPQTFSQVIDQFSREPRILDIVTQILGSDVYIHQSRVNVKPALTGKSFPWHSDFETWHVEDGMPKPRAVSAWIMLTKNDEFNGPLYIIPGSHKHYVSCVGKTPAHHYEQSLKKQAYGTPSLKAIKVLAEENGMTGIFGSPGTVVFHESNMMHGSPDNISIWPRTNLFFVYNSISNALDKPYSGQAPRPDYLSNRHPSALSYHRL
jgi:ectoine hydroxylase